MLEVLPDRILKPKLSSARIGSRPFAVTSLTENPAGPWAVSSAVIAVSLRLDYKNASLRHNNVIDLCRCTILSWKHNIAENAKPLFVQLPREKKMKQPFSGRSGIPFDERA